MFCGSFVEILERFDIHNWVVKELLKAVYVFSFGYEWLLLQKIDRKGSKGYDFL